MIYRFNLISDEVDDFKLEIQIDSDDTFLSRRIVKTSIIWSQLDIQKTKWIRSSSAMKNGTKKRK